MYNNSVHKFFNEQNAHALFKIGVIIKAIDGTLEFLFSLALYVVPPALLSGFFSAMVQGELFEDPKDFFANLFVRGANTVFFEARLWIVLFFITHGTVKLFLAWGLLKGKIWAYPVSIAVFLLFISVQSYRLFFHPSVLLGVATIFDALMVGLIAHEYKHFRERRVAWR